MSPIATSEKPKKPPALVASCAILSQTGPRVPVASKKNQTCTTTPVPRGRPRKNPLPACSALSPLRPRPRARPQPSPPLPTPPPQQPVYKTSPSCPELTPEFVAHCFEAIQFTTQYNHPLISRTSIKMDIRAVSFQLHRLPPQSRVLALCIICCAALTSFHPSVLGDGPRPESFTDANFFLSPADFLPCGVRRAKAYRALRIEALKAAWEIGIILQPSDENAASCYLLDLLEQYDFVGVSRPWGNAYMSHVRALAPIWRAANAYTISEGVHWIGYLMGDALLSTRNRTPMLVTTNDQLLLCGPPPPSLEDLIASLSKSTSIPTLWTSLSSYLYHVVDLSRQLSENIAGDYARLSPLSENAVLNFLSSLSMMHSVLCLLLGHLDQVLATTPNADDSSLIPEDTARTCAYGAIFGFIGLIFPFYRELEYRETNDAQTQRHTYNRPSFLWAQAYDMVLLGVQEMARAFRYLPKVHYTPVHWNTVYAWAEFCAKEIESGAPISHEFMRDTQTIVNELKLMGYSLEAASAPQSVALIERLERHVSRTFVDMFLPPEMPLEGTWMGGPLLNGPMIFAC
ncbi:Zn(2)-C6 fungal-type domain-containing protein [Mycena sanguinolenta]|uniref:Zn(2)-C6 fungal-type domain-containing protein n=1 Tax=Mycena sanguinolenta TaxID=230812 RepID=A0A8H6YH94_9AGAR|nr:Zn(2)-C6 fungal-type domain-containing protein [Mycena sanguinolenta]